MVSCNVCGEGNALLNADAMVMQDAITCGQLDLVARHVIDAEYCTTLQAEANVTCCTVIDTPATVDNRTVDTPTRAPGNDTSRTATTEAPTGAPNTTELSPGSPAEASAASSVWRVMSVPTVLLLVGTGLC